MEVEQGLGKLGGVGLRAGQAWDPCPLNSLLAACFLCQAPSAPRRSGPDVPADSRVPLGTRVQSPRRGSASGSL